jgi:hypothetical protein
MQADPVFWIIRPRTWLVVIFPDALFPLSVELPASPAQQAIYYGPEPLTALYGNSFECCKSRLNHFDLGGISIEIIKGSCQLATRL